MHSFRELLSNFSQPSGAPAVPRPTSESRPTAADARANVAAGRAVLESHRQRFDLVSSPILDLVDSAIVAMQPDLVEPSVKLTGGQLFAERVNLYFHEQDQLSPCIGEIFEFYDRVRAHLGRDFDDRILASLLDLGLRLDACRDLIMGLDMRPDRESSRLKLYFLVDESHEELVTRLWDFGKQSCPGGPHGDALDWLVPTWTQLFGLDLGFDGTSRLKVYAGAPAFAYPRLRDSLGLDDEAAALVEQAPFCMLSLLDRPIPLQLLLPGDAVFDLLTSRRAGPMAGRVAETVERRCRYVLSVAADQVATGPLDPMNLYYADTRYSGGDTHVLQQ